jgi:hypothetical protein
MLDILARHVRLDWSRMKARGEEVAIDLRRGRCIVTDPNEASVELPNGWDYFSRRIEVDYQTMAVRSFGGRGGQRTAQKGGAR